MTLLHLLKLRVLPFEGSDLVYKRVNGFTDEKMIPTPFSVIEMVRVHDGNELFL